MKNAWWLIAWVLIGLGLGAGIVHYGIAPICTPEQISYTVRVDQSQPLRTRDNSKSQREQTQAGKQGNSVFSANIEKQEFKGEHNREYWWKGFLCELKLGDAAVAFFTWCLVVATWFTMRHVDDSAKKTNRAYIFGGGPYGERRDGRPLPRGGSINKPEDFRDKKFLTIQNYGKTPGVVTGVWYGFCKPEDYPLGSKMDDIIKGKTPIPKESIIEVKHPGEFFPSTDGPDWLRYRHVQFFRSEHVGEVFFGKIEYQDVFREKHYSTFKLFLNEDGYSDPFDGGYGEYN